MIHCLNGKRKHQRTVFRRLHALGPIRLQGQAQHFSAPPMLPDRNMPCSAWIFPLFAADPGAVPNVRPNLTQASRQAPGLEFQLALQSAFGLELTV